MAFYNLGYAYDATCQGVTFDYDGLDPRAAYVVRISIGDRIGYRRPAGYRMREGLNADGTVLSEGFDVPTDTTGYFEFDIPQSLTQDGKVQIALTSNSEERPVTALYEIWLTRKDRMTWTAR